MGTYWNIHKSDAEDEDVEEEPESRPCGCPWDYHLADCPILTDRGDYPPEPYDEDEEW